MGQHERLLHETLTALQTLNTQVQHLTCKVDQVLSPPDSSTSSGEVTGPPPQLNASPPSHPSPPNQRSSFPHEARIALPRSYDGRLGDCRAFLMQCAFVFQHQSVMYASEQVRVAYVTNLLSGRALTWAESTLSRGSEMNSSYSAFTEEFRRVFDHPSRGIDAASQLFSLSQASHSVAEYAVEFRIIASNSGWNDDALRCAFRRGLSDEVKDGLAVRDRATSLDNLIELSIRLDNRLQERRREKSHRPTDYNSHVPRHQRFSPEQNSQSRATPRLVNRSSSPSEEEPMQLGRTRISPTERQRRVSMGMCLYCGAPGHVIALCPQRPKELARQ